MRITHTLATAASLTALATATMAGGLSDEIMEAPVEVADELAPAGTSVNPTYVVLGVLAALLIAAAIAEDDDDDEEDDTPTDDEVLLVPE